MKSIKEIINLAVIPDIILTEVSFVYIRSSLLGPLTMLCIVDVMPVL